MKKRLWKRTMKKSLCLLLVAMLFVTGGDWTALAAETDTQLAEEVQTTEETQEEGEIEAAEEQEAPKETTEEIQTTTVPGLTKETIPNSEVQTQEKSKETQMHDEMQSDGETQSEEESQTQITDIGVVENSNMKARSTNSFGRLFANSINTELAEEVEGTNCDIFSITVTDTTAFVSFQTIEDGMLVVGVYEDDGVKLLATGSTEVSKGDTEAEVPIEIDSLPEYFCLKGYLVETNSLRPLSTVYENLDYTEKMQNFFAKTTDDFANDKIINLDKDESNNFLVFKDEVTVIQSNGEDSVNEVVECDEDNLVYTIENADKQIAELTEGTIFAYYYADNEAIIAKVESVEIDEDGDNKTVTIYGDESADLGDIFAYIKIGAENPRQPEQNIYAVSSREASVAKSWKYSFGYPKDNDDGGEKLPNKPTFSGDKSLEFSIDGYIGGDNTLTIYSEEESAIEWVNLEIAYKVGIEASFSGSVEGDILLGHLDLPTSVPGVLIETELKLFVEAEAKISVSGELTGSFGVKIQRDKAVNPYKHNPHFETSAKIEGSITFGVKVEAGVKAIHEKIASVTVSAKGGVELDASYTIWEGSTEEDEEKEEGLERHGCKYCIDGDIYLVFSLGIEAVIMTKQIGPFSLDLGTEEGIEAKIKLGDFYYSIDYDERGFFKECPHKEYRVAVTVFRSTSSLNRVEGARVNNKVATNEKGQASLWLPDGKQIINAVYEGKSGSSAVIVNSAKSVIVYLGTNTDQTVDNAVIDISLADGFSSAVTKEGDLYLWGSNACGQLGNGNTTDQNTPCKVKEVTGADNNTTTIQSVKSVRISQQSATMITKKGSLYMWGQNNFNQIGYGPSGNRVKPKLVLENVKEVEFDSTGTAAITKDGKLYAWGRVHYGSNSGSCDQTEILENENVEKVRIGYAHSAAVTKDGKLYLWGENSCGQLGTGDTMSQLMPTQVLESKYITEVQLSNASFAVSPYSAAITKDGELYLWGSNGCGQLGTGDTTDQHEPVQILKGETVTAVSLGAKHSAAITKDGSLYMWGDNSRGQLGSEDENLRMLPEKVEGLGKVKTVVLQGDISAAITENGNLYLWGYNNYGQIGNGTSNGKIPQKTPYKVLDDVKSVSLTDKRAAAVTKDGSLWMWGYNENGQVGNGNTLTITIPTQIRFTDNTAVATSLNILSEHDNQATMQDTGNSLQSPIEYDNLLPNETYNFYVMQSKMDENRLGSDNLLYIGQYISDADGKLRIFYETAKGYENAETFLVGMTRTDLSSAEITIADITADGEEHFVDATVIYKGQTLMPGIDYEISGDCIIKTEGEYKVTVRGIGIYGGEKEISFHVKKADSEERPSEPESGSDIESESESAPEIGSEPQTGDDGEDTGNGDVLPEDIPADGKFPKGLWIAGIAADGYAYTGKAIKPKVRIYDHTTLLKEKKDYTISYKNNVKASVVAATVKEPTITVTGKGNYSGKETAVFSILALDIATGAFDADDIAIVYNAKKAQKPLTTLWWNGKSLKNKTDYSITYYDKTGTKKLEDVKDVGEYYLEFTGTGNFSGTRRVKLTVSDSLMMIHKASVTKIGKQTYTGAEVKPVLTVKDGKNLLTENTHYTVRYVNNTDIGTAYAVITGIGTYSGTKRIAFQITGPSIAKAAVEIPIQTYTGAAINPETKLTIKVNDKMQTLRKDTDYTVKWQNNHIAGTATVIFTGINGYSGTLKKTFKILPFDIGTNTDKRFVAAMNNSVPYAKGGAKPTLTVSFKGINGVVQKLKEGTDYTVTYKNNTAVNDNAMLIIKGKGSFTGTMPLTYQVTKQDIRKLVLTPADRVYQNKKNVYGTKVTITDVDGKALSAGKDYDKAVTYTYKNNTILEGGTLRTAGTIVDKEDIIPAETVITVTALAAGNGNYTGSVSGDYRITQESLSSAKITVPAQDYTGKEITLTESQITVTVKGQTLSPEQYQIVTGSYKNNIQKGNASVTIQGKGNYGGSKTVKFTIKTKGFFWWWKKK